MRSFEGAARALQIPFKTVPDTFAGGREAYESTLILVRPDQYVVWNGNAPPADPRVIMRRVVGRA